MSIKGQKLGRDVIFVSNHLGWIEIPVLAGVTGTAFVAQSALEHWPVLGFLADLNHTIYVSRTDKMSVAAQVSRLTQALLHTQPVTIFPEGTTTDGHHLLPFKPSLFAALDPPPRAISVQPILLSPDVIGHDLAWIGEESGIANACRIMRQKRTWQMNVQFLEPFNPSEIGDRKAIAAEAHKRVAAALAASLVSSETV